MGAGAGDVLVGAIEGEGVVGYGRGARGGGMGAEVVLGEGDGEGGVGWEVEFWVAFAPVSAGILISMMDSWWGYSVFVGGRTTLSQQC